MWKPRLRFSIRTGMIVTAVIAVSLGATMALLRYQKMSRIAARYAWYEHENTKIADDFAAFLSGDPLPRSYAQFLALKQSLPLKAKESVPYGMAMDILARASNEPEYEAARAEAIGFVRSVSSQIAPHKRKVAAHYAGLRSKYERAALDPTVPIGKDGPEPPP